MNESIIKRAVELNDPTLALEALREIDVLLCSSSDQNERVYLLFSRVSCYGILGDFEEARRQLSSASQETPDDLKQVMSDFMEGLLSQQEGNFHAAFERFSAVLVNYAQNLKQPQLRFMYEDIQQRRAFLLVTLQQFQNAIPLFREILSFDLENEVRSEALASLGLCYLELQKWDLARDYFLEARAIGVTKEREATFHFYLGIAYFHTEALTEAKREFVICENRASEYQLPILDVYAWLSSVSKRLGETAEAERYARLARAN